jgi:hypothetical protein
MFINSASVKLHYMSKFPPQSAVSVRQTTVKLDLKVAISSYISLRQGETARGMKGGGGGKLPTKN